MSSRRNDLFSGEIAIALLPKLGIDPVRVFRVILDLEIGRVATLEVRRCERDGRRRPWIEERYTLKRCDQTISTLGFEAVEISSQRREQRVTHEDLGG